MESKSSDWVRGPSGPTVCRCCFAEGCYKDISTEYFWMGKREVYAEMLTETFDLSIAFARTSGPNSNSRLICEPCISRLRDASEFKRQVQECEKMFMQYLDPGRVVVTEVEMEIAAEPVDKDVKVEHVKQEKNQSDDDFEDRGGFDDMDDDDLDDQPLMKLASKVPKKESVDILDLLDNTKAAEKRKSTTKTKATPAKKSKTKKETPKATASKVKPEKKKKDIDGAKKSAEAAKKNAKIILSHSTAYPFKYKVGSMQCCICFNIFEEPAQFRAHMDTDHPDVDKSKIIGRDKLGRTRVDITDLRCKSCKDKFTTIENLIMHLNSRHGLGINVNYHHGLVPLKLDKNHYQCLMCSKLFTGIKPLAMHSGSHFFKHICDICGRRFETSGGLQLHVQYNHSSKEICRRCKKSFPTPEARKLHIKTTKDCQPTKCQICGERFLHWNQREEHLVTVHMKERTVFPCTECDNVYHQRTLLYAHFKTTHTNENKCTYCDKQYSTVPKLKEHIARYHTGERAFACHLCDMKYIDQQALKRHLITHDDSKKVACPICDKLYARRYKLKVHMEKSHLEHQNST